VKKKPGEIVPPVSVLEEPKATTCPECRITIPAYSSDVIVGSDSQRRHSGCHKKAERAGRIAAFVSLAPEGALP